MSNLKILQESPATTIYLDVDGVINAISARPPRTNTQWSGDWSQVNVCKFPILYSHELVQHLNDLAALPNVTVKWLTSWEELAPQELAPAIGLTNGHNWPVIYGVEYDDPKRWWKLDAIKADLAPSATQPSQAVWLDDDIDYDRASLTWLQAPPVPVLHISPRSAHGLSKKHLKTIFNYVTTPTQEEN